MVAWSKVCQARKEGCIGLRDFCSFNLALLGKCTWQLSQGREEGSFLWQKIIIGKWYRGRFLSVVEVHVGRVSWIWRAYLRQKK